MAATGMPVLAIDTATRYAGLALYDGESVLAELSWRAGQSHTTTLMPNLVRLLHHQDLAVAQLGGLVVALGPGSFTGLRIGLAVAKGLAMAQDLPLVGVPTLDIVAWSCDMLSSFAGEGMSLQAYLEAGRERFCVADYRRVRGGIRREGDYRIVTWDELGIGVEGPTLFCGELDARAEQLLRNRLGDWALIVPPAERLRRPGYLAELGWQRLMSGNRDDPATLSPIYLRTSGGRRPSSREDQP